MGLWHNLASPRRAAVAQPDSIRSEQSETEHAVSGFRLPPSTTYDGDFGTCHGIKAVLGLPDASDDSPLVR